MALAQDTYERCQRQYGRGVPELQMCELSAAWLYAAAGEMTRAIKLVTA